MEQDHGDLQVIIRDDVVDYRQKNMQGQSKTRSIEMEDGTSAQIALASRASGDAEKDITRVDVLRKFANNLYHGQQQVNASQKDKVLWKTTARNRATSADPRFRRERSPSKDAGQTQSDSKVVLHIPHGKEPPIPPRPTGPYPTDQSEPVGRTASSVEQKQSVSSELHTCRSFFTDASSLKRSTGGRLAKKEAAPVVNNEQSTMTEVKDSEEYGGIKDSFETVESREKGKETQKSKLDKCSTSVVNLDKPTSSLKYHWDDPRLIEKYSNLLKPVQVRQSRSSWTLPLTSPAPLADLPPFCTKCTCVKQVKEATTSYEHYEEDVLENYDKIKLNVYGTLSSNYYMAVFFMIGSLCGLMLVALVVWVLANDIIWSYMNKEETPKLTGLKWFSAYVGGAILHSLNVVCSQFYHMLIMPRNEIFDNPER